MPQQHGAPLLMHARVSFIRDSLLPVYENRLKQPPFINKNYIKQEEADSTSGFHLDFSIVSGV